MPNNGLQSFGFHQYDDSHQTLKGISNALNIESFNTGSKKDINPEIVAKKYLEHLFSSPQEEFKRFTDTKSSDNATIGFETLRTDYLPITGHKIVKFRQRMNKISVYGSVASIELDENNDFVSVNSSLAEKLPEIKTAAISAEQARAIAEDYLKQKIDPEITPLLYYYYHTELWKLVFILKDIPVYENANKKEYTKENEHIHESPSLVNAIIDAQNGKMLEITPATISFRSPETGVDENGVVQTFFASDDGNSKVLIDDNLLVYTYFNSYNTYYSPLMPGTLVAKNGSSWDTAAVSAHVNACKVAEFLRNILKRNSVDGAGMKIISSTQCVRIPGIKNWFNAVWLGNRNQMAYGQTMVGGKLKSLAASLDVVAHEIFHGVTQFSARLEYHNQSGAMNESYSDIFGIILSNIKNPDAKTWNWELGEEISGVPIRNIKQPSLFRQPEHMNDYKNLPDTEDGDWGGVHTNSGIHNKAAYRLLTSAQQDGRLVFSPVEIAQLYYYALLQLAEKSNFSDSYRSVKNAAKSLFKNDPALSQKLSAIDTAFNSVGIQ